MVLKHLPFRAPLEKYHQLAVELLAGQKSGDPKAIKIIHANHPRFLDSKIVWLPRTLSGEEIRSAPFDIADAQLSIARWHSFRNWVALAKYTLAVTTKGSPVHQFETAIEAVITGDLPSLRSLLSKHPDLVLARSTRITNHDPAKHRATLLHYIAANGIEGYRQKTPKNAVAIAKALLKAGADPDALAGMYGCRCTTMSMLGSSSHPAQAGVQVALVNTLCDYGASVEPLGSKRWGSPLMTALASGFLNAAKALVRRGANVNDLAAAAGLGRLADAERLLKSASAKSRHLALALSTQLGHADTVKLLLDAGQNPNRYNPAGNHSHSTPLHQAVCAGRMSVVRLLVARGARLKVKDKIYDGTPLDWAFHCGQPAIEKYLAALH